MKRAWAAAVLVLALAVSLQAQMRGVPASVTSISPARGMDNPPGVPASVTSSVPRRTIDPVPWHSLPSYANSVPCSGGAGPLIPSAMGCTSTQFTSHYFYPDGRDRGRVNLRPRHPQYWPVYVPYSYPVVYPVVETAPEPVAEPEPPALTVFEHRPTTAYAPAHTPTVADESRYGTHYLDGRENPPAPAAPASDARESITTLLIFRDGHQQEVKNYAIVGATLYDLGTFVAQKIPLALLDLPATIRANEERGVEFNVPTPVKAQ